MLRRGHFTKKKYQAPEPIRDGTINQLIHLVGQNSAVGVGGDATLQNTPGGPVIAGKRRFVWMFELTEDMRRPDPTRTSGSSTEPDCFWAENSKPVLYIGDEYLYRSLGGENYTPTIYQPNCFRTKHGIAIGDPRLGKNDRVWCIFNSQSNRWELIERAATLWAFELAEDLNQWATEPVRAYLRDWSSDGWGSYTSNCNVEFYVADWRQIGYFGPAGHTGAAEIRQVTGGAGTGDTIPGTGTTTDVLADTIVGVIVDLRCPPDCLCGVTGPDGDCVTGTGTT